MYGKSKNMIKFQFISDISMAAKKKGKSEQRLNMM